jgi:curved DNA-binding protein
MEYRDYYQTLGVQRNATDKEIKRAYRELARRHHPDLNPGDKNAENRFKELNEAYEVLSDPEKRSRYDQLGISYWQWQRNGGSGSFDWSRWASNVGTTGTARRGRTARVEFDNGSGGGIFSDFFNSIFGDSNRETRTPKKPIRGRDVEVTASITLEEAYHGTTRKISNGESEHLFTAHIPAGATDGTKVRFANQGKRGFAGGERGDLFVIVSVEPHPVFERNGDDLYMDLKLGLYTAVLGGEVRIATLNGDIKLRIPPGTQSGQRIRLNQKGMPRLRDAEQFGDLYVRPLIQVPTELSEEECQLFEKLRKLRRVNS